MSIFNFMKDNNLSELLNKFFLERFLLQFVPGIILYIGFYPLIKISSEEALISFIIVGSLSWGLGLLLEIVFFNQVYKQRESESGLSRKKVHYLLFAKLGISCAIAGILAFIASTTNFLEYWEYKTDAQMVESFIKRTILITLGGVLWYKFNQKLSEN